DGRGGCPDDARSGLVFQTLEDLLQVCAILTDRDAQLAVRLDVAVVQAAVEVNHGWLAHDDPGIEAFRDGAAGPAAWAGDFSDAVASALDDGLVAAATRVAHKNHLRQQCRLSGRKQGEEPDKQVVNRHGAPVCVYGLVHCGLPAGFLDGQTRTTT